MDAGPSALLAVLQLGRPEKIRCADEAKNGRSKVRKAVRQKKLESKRNDFWYAIREAVERDVNFMTQSARWREIDKLERQRSDPGDDVPHSRPRRSEWSTLESRCRDSEDSMV